MIIVMNAHSRDEDIAMVEQKVRELGYEPHTIRGEVRTVVETVMPVQKKYTLISRETHPDPTIIRVGDMEIGGGAFHIVAGPCSVESDVQMLETARRVVRAGATIIRGGAFKPRTSPYSFQGLGVEGLPILARTREELHVPVITEVLRESDIEAVASVADVLQIGARNAMNYALLEAVADTGKPILLKRGLAATINEWLLAAEYMVKKGNRNIILCERGIRTFETETRNTLDISAVAIAKQETCLPVFVDPSHAAGRLDIIHALSKAAIAAGADGIMVEVHIKPEEALSDGSQQFRPDVFGELVEQLEPYIRAAGKQMISARVV